MKNKLINLYWDIAERSVFELIGGALLGLMLVMMVGLAARNMLALFLGWPLPQVMN